LPQVKKEFGERVLLKVDVEHKVTGDGSWWAGYKSKSLEQMKRKVKKDTEHNRIELELDLYIFDRIDNEEEKERRRREIFNFVQYLKDEGLFEYLEMRIVIMDERVLAPSYDKFERKIYFSRKVEKEIAEENEIIQLPPKKLRVEMSKQLQNEVDNMSLKEMLVNMEKINKEDLTYKGIRKWNSQYQDLIYSEKILKEKYGHDSSYEKIKEYDDMSDISIGSNLEYVYIN